jgi:hypothetical protein
MPDITADSAYMRVHMKFSITTIRLDALSVVSAPHNLGLSWTFISLLTVGQILQLRCSAYMDLQSEDIFLGIVQPKDISATRIDAQTHVVGRIIFGRIFFRA